MQHTIAQCSAAAGTAGMSYVQIPGASISNMASLDTFCGSKFTNNVDVGGANGAAANGAEVSGAVIGSYQKAISEPSITNMT